MVAFAGELERAERYKRLWRKKDREMREALRVWYLEVFGIDIWSDETVEVGPAWDKVEWPKDEKNTWNDAPS